MKTPDHVATSRWCSRPLRLVTGAFLCILVAAGLGVANVGAVRTSARPRTSVKPDFGYYRGKTITMYDYGAAGGETDLELRILAPYVAAYLHASVFVQDATSTTTSIAGQNFSASQPPNGLTIGTLGGAGDIGDFVAGIPGLQFSIRSVSVLTSPAPLQTVLITTPGSGLTTFKQVVDSQTPVTILETQASTDGTLAQLLYGSFGFPNKFVYGYSSGSSLVNGFVRGDGESTFFAFTSFLTEILSHIAIPVLGTEAPLKGSEAYSIMKNVPTVEKFAASNPPKTKSQKAELAEFERLNTLAAAEYYAPAGTPEKYTFALDAALKWAFTRGGVKQQETSLGIVPSYLSASTVKNAINNLIKTQGQLKVWLSQTGAVAT